MHSDSLHTYNNWNNWLWPVNMTGNTKSWLVNSPVSPDIVHWPAVVSSPVIVQCHAWILSQPDTWTSRRRLHYHQFFPFDSWQETVIVFGHWLSTNQIRELYLPLPGTSFWSLKEIIGKHFMMAATTHRTPWLKEILIERKWWLYKILSKGCISRSLKPYICLTYTEAALCFVRVASLRLTDWIICPRVTC